MVHETELTVRYAETDQMGIVHHANYYVWFELARTEFIKETGFSYSDVEKRGFLLPLARCSCQYVRGAKYEDRILVQARLVELKRTKCVFSYTVLLKETQDLIAKGETVHGFVDQQMKPVNFQKQFPELYKKMQGFLSQ